jgi:hypothetical protein
MRRLTDTAKAVHMVANALATSAANSISLNMRRHQQRVHFERSNKLESKVAEIRQATTAAQI